MNGAEVSFVGNVTRDPELRFSSAGKAWATFSVAVNRFSRDRNGEKQEKTTFFNCKTFGDMAENIANSVGKGMRVMVTGTLENEEWTDKEGNKRSSIVLVVDEIGPSLRWATAEVKKISRGNGNGQAPVRTGAVADAPTGFESPDFGDENPFA